MTEITPPAFDTLLPGRRRERPVWTLPAIAHLIGVGTDTVRTLAKEKGSPIKRKGGRWYCYESDLVRWMKDQGTA